MAPDPWQRLVLDDWLRESRGKWASLTCGLSVPRQNGKNALLEVREIFGMAGLGERIVHTAHQVKTAQKHFRRLKHFFGVKANDPAARFPELNALVASVRNVNGQESIELKNGGGVEIVARSTNSARGYTVDVIVCDEAQNMSDEDQEALLSTSSSAPLGNPQWLYTGTPPGPSVNGEVFTRVRADALGQAPGRVCWHEWSAESGCDMDDRSVWERVNPALASGRLLWDVVAAERASYSDAGFGRERLGMWEEAHTLRVIGEAAWEACRDEFSRPGERRVLGVDVAPDRSMSSVAAASVRPDGRTHVEVIGHSRGADWLGLFISERWGARMFDAVVVDERSAAAGLADALRTDGVPVLATTTGQLAAACGGFYDACVSGSVAHLGQPPLDVAVDGARKRDVGDAWAWNRKNPQTDITPLVAVTLAAWGVGREAPRTRRRGTGKVMVW